MDLGRIEAAGVSTTKKAWITNPVRRTAWSVLRPFFHGVAAEVARSSSVASPAMIQTIESGRSRTENLQPDRMLFRGFDPEALRALVPLCQWVHSIDLGNGQVSPGQWGSNPAILAAGLEFAGKHVLDVGCWDGLYSFYAEEKGAATVFATDLISARSYNEFPTFHLAHRIRASKAKYYSDLSVFDLSLLGKTDFDIVLFAGVYYHLRDPLRALDSIRSVMKRGGTLLVEGAIIQEEGCHAKFYHETAFCGDPTNWWVPTAECLEQWIKSSGFSLVRSYSAGGHFENQRHMVLASAR